MLPYVTLLFASCETGLAVLVPLNKLMKNTEMLFWENPYKKNIKHGHYWIGNTVQQ